MPDMIGIKYLDSLYVIQRKNKFNITAIAITTEKKKIASSMYATKDDITKIYNAYIDQKDTNQIDTTISSGVFKLTKYVIPSKEFGMVPMYNVEIGDFKCKMSPSTYDQFIITLETAYRNIKNRSGLSNIIPFKKKKKKGIFE